jgi:hypothetical protein
MGLLSLRRLLSTLRRASKCLLIFQQALCPIGYSLLFGFSSSDLWMNRYAIRCVQMNRFVSLKALLSVLTYMKTLLICEQ